MLGQNKLPPGVAPIAAAALRIKPRGLLTEPQAAVVDPMKKTRPSEEDPDGCRGCTPAACSLDQG